MTRGESSLPPGRRWPTSRDSRVRVTGDLRVRGWTWSLSMVWLAAGAVTTGYIFYATNHPYSSADIDGTGVIGFSAGLAAVQIVAILASFAWLALLLPVLIAGLIRLRGWRPATGSARPRGQARGSRAPLCCRWPTLGEILQGWAGESCHSVPDGSYSGH